jgi:hypothetical protein
MIKPKPPAAPDGEPARRPGDPPPSARDAAIETVETNDPTIAPNPKTGAYRNSQELPVDEGGQIVKSKADIDLLH